MNNKKIIKYWVRCDGDLYFSKTFHNEDVAKGYIAGVEARRVDLKGAFTIEKIEVEEQA